MYYMGVDVGSTTSKGVVLDETGAIKGKGLRVGGAGTKGPQGAIDQALDEAGITQEEIAKTCATGYGRRLLVQADEERSELSCHAKGASLLFPTAHTVIDIGGQDAKVLRVGNGGLLEDFVMNDKCAAGTGRFLDVMASVFGCSVSELSDYDSQSSGIASISSTCTVFAESEVVSKLAAGEGIPNIVAGIHTSVVEKTYGLVKRLGITPDVAMTGGVALNGALRHRLEKKLECTVLTSPIAQYNGALGAALFAQQGKEG